MKKITAMKDALLLKRMKAEDAVRLPMDENFYDNLHNNIMAAVEKTEIRAAESANNSWLFLDKKAQESRAKLK